MPEILWKAYVDFEVDEQGDREKARSLYERLISLSGHHKVWISYAEFEGSSIPLPRVMREEEEEDVDVEPRVVAGDPILARQVFERGYRDLRGKGLKAEVRSHRLDTWIKRSTLIFAAGCFTRGMEGVRGGQWYRGGCS